MAAAASRDVRRLQIGGRAVSSIFIRLVQTDRYLLSEPDERDSKADCCHEEQHGRTISILKTHELGDKQVREKNSRADAGREREEYSTLQQMSSAEEPTKISFQVRPLLVVF